MAFLHQSRAQYVALKLNPHLEIDILNVYEFIHTGPPAMLWNHLAQVDLPEAEWFLAGDFNNIKNAQDKERKSSQKNIRCRELEAWNR